jgi:putative transposon-encoded protein
MAKVKLNIQSELKLKSIKGFIEKTITKFGTGAKVDAPKEFLGKKVYVLIRDD